MSLPAGSLRRSRRHISRSAPHPAPFGSVDPENHPMPDPFQGLGCGADLAGAGGLAVQPNIPIARKSPACGLIRGMGRISCQAWLEKRRTERTAKLKDRRSAASPGRQDARRWLPPGRLLSQRRRGFIRSMEAIGGCIRRESALWGARHSWRAVQDRRHGNGDGRPCSGWRSNPLMPQNTAPGGTVRRGTFRPLSLIRS